MIKKLVSCLLALFLSVSMVIYSFAENSSDDVLINSILTGQSVGDGTIVYDEANNQYNIFSSISMVDNDFVAIRGEHGTFKSGKYNVPIKVNNIDNGATTPIVWLGGTDNTMDNDKSIMQSSIFSNNNVIYISSKFDGVRIDGYKCTFGKADMEVFASSAADKIIETYPDADSYVVVSFSLGGYATNHVQDALKQSGKKVIGIGLLDSRDTKYGNTTAEKDNTPMLILGSSDGRPINDRTIKYAYSFPALTTNMNEVLMKPFFKQLNTNHGGLELLDEAQQILHDFYDTVTTNDTNKTPTSGTSNIDLKKNQSGLLNKLNSSKVSASVKNSTTNLVSGALSNLIKTTNSVNKTSASTSSTDKVKTNNSLISNITKTVTNKITSTVTKLKDAFNKVLAA